MCAQVCGFEDLSPLDQKALLRRTVSELVMLGFARASVPYAGERREKWEREKDGKGGRGGIEGERGGIKGEREKECFVFLKLYSFVIDSNYE